MLLSRVTVFENETCATEYFRRGWRQLSENKIPRPGGDQPTPPTSGLYNTLLHQELPVPPSSPATQG